MSRELEIVQALEGLAESTESFRAEDLAKTWAPNDYRGDPGLQDGLAPGRLAAVRRVLRTLEVLGAVKRKPDGTFQVVGTNLVSAWPGQSPGNSPDSKGGGRSTPPPPSDGGAGGRGNGGGEKGGGFREVLSHPHLFTLAPEELQVLLASIE